MFASLTKQITDWRNDRQTARILAELDPRILADIGIDKSTDPLTLRGPGLYGGTPRAAMRL